MSVETDQGDYIVVSTDDHLASCPEENTVSTGEQNSRGCRTTEVTDTKALWKHPFVHAMRPLLTAMTLTGTLCERVDKGRWCAARLVYPVIVSVLVWTHFFLLFGWYVQDFKAPVVQADELLAAGQTQVNSDGVFTLMILIHCWCFQHGTLTVIGFLLSFRLPRLVSNWKALFGDDQKACEYHRLRRVTWCLSVVCTSVVIQSQVLMTIWELLHNYERHHVPTLITVFMGNSPPPFYVVVLYHILLFYLVSVSLYPFFLFVGISFALGQEFKRLSLQLHNAFDQNEIAVSIENLRRRHNDLCRLATTINKCFRGYTLVVYITGLPAMYYAGYSMVTLWSSMNFLIQVLTCSAVAMHALMTFIMTLSAALVNHLATLPHGMLHRIKFDAAHHNAIVISQVLVFLDRVSRGHIGFNAGGLFFITRKTMTALLILTFSYLVLLKFCVTWSHSEAQSMTGDNATLAAANVTLYYSAVNQTATVPLQLTTGQTGLE